MTVANAPDPFKMEEERAPKEKKGGRGMESVSVNFNNGLARARKKRVGRANPIPIEAKWTQAHMNSLEQTLS